MSFRITICALYPHGNAWWRHKFAQAAKHLIRDVLPLHLKVCHHRSVWICLALYCPRLNTAATSYARNIVGRIGILRSGVGWQWRIIQSLSLDV